MPLSGRGVVVLFLWLFCVLLMHAGQTGGMVLMELRLTWDRRGCLGHQHGLPCIRRMGL